MIIDPIGRSMQATAGHSLRSTQPAVPSIAALRRRIVDRPENGQSVPCCNDCLPHREWFEDKLIV
jgi:hypothetical protein